MVAAKVSAALLAGVLVIASAWSSPPAMSKSGSRENRCKKQSADNLLSNAGFDRNLSSWRTETAKARFSTEDADRCSSSGSVSFQPRDPDTISSQCVRVRGGERYNFGVRVKVPSNVLVAGCEVRLRTGQDCTALSPNDNSRSAFLNSSTTAEWHTVETSFVLPSDIKSALVSCGPGGSGGTGTVFIDRVFLTKSPGRF